MYHFIIHGKKKYVLKIGCQRLFKGFPRFQINMSALADWRGMDTRGNIGRSNDANAVTGNAGRQIFQKKRLFFWFNMLNHIQTICRIKNGLWMLLCKITTDEIKSGSEFAPGLVLFYDKRFNIYRIQ